MFTSNSWTPKSQQQQVQQQQQANAGAATLVTRQLDAAKNGEAPDHFCIFSQPEVSNADVINDLISDAMEGEVTAVQIATTLHKLDVSRMESDNVDTLAHYLTHAVENFSDTDKKIVAVGMYDLCLHLQSTQRDVIIDTLWNKANLLEGKKTALPATPLEARIKLHEKRRMCFEAAKPA